MISILTQKKLNVTQFIQGDYMKKLLLNTLFIISGLSQASIEGINIASMDYQCEMNGITRDGTVMITKREVKGKPSCMFFRKGPTICFRFERIADSNINDIFFAVRKAEDLMSAPYEKFISLGNMRYAEGAYYEHKVKTSLLSKSKISCVFTNVEWDR